MPGKWISDISRELVGALLHIDEQHVEVRFECISCLLLRKCVTCRVFIASYMMQVWKSALLNVEATRSVDSSVQMCVTCSVFLNICFD